MRRVALATAASLLLPACGGEDDSTMARAEEAMADLKAGAMVVELSATADGVDEPVGFRVDGRFSFVSDGELPVFEFDYTELLAGEEVVTTITSDGAQVAVEADGEVRVLDRDEAASLELGDDEGFADLGVASWVEDPSEERRGDGTVVTGTVDVPDLLADLATISAQVAGGGSGELSDDEAERLSRLVERSTIEVVVGDGDLPRTIDATIDFGGEVPDELVEAIGPYAGAQLRLLVELEPLDEDLTIPLPS